MIAGLIFVVSLAALLQFFVSYCRSILAASKIQPLSEDAREVSGLNDVAPRAEDFRRLVQLARLCPEPGDDRNEVRFVHGYYRLLKILRAVAGRLAAGGAAWAENERDVCAYFAAVVLDRRIAYSRSLMAQQMGNQL